TIAGARLPIQIDVGFGDVITPEPIEIEYPALLDAPAPILRAYPPETVVAEKTEAIVSLGIGNSRMKDFYDLWMIARTFAFERDDLAAAIRRTFQRRRTPLPEQVPVGFSDSFALERETQWRAFLARDRLEVASASLVQVIDDLRAFLQPMLTRDEVASWPPGGPWTEVKRR
ncbi:MAG: nucleotidyl transferase AbiEii/AbiGii toxin family protein, partial [Gammaproteobacteria bacterium]|nr:nucleotidyl transferase AbiEii/AbiGii toxin family protein [Gammaproteobacteria bacterium]